jgi:hypothetical protein
MGLVAILLPGCVHLEVRPLEKGDEDKKTHGVRFYRPAPYLWLAADGKGGCIPSVVYLPDPQQEFIMRIAPFDGAIGIGTVSMKPTLQDGWNLTGLESSVDTKVPETLTAIAGLAKTAMGFEVAVAGRARTELRDRTGQRLSAGLYRIGLDPKVRIPTFEPVLQVYPEGAGEPLPCTSPSGAAPPENKDKGKDK